MKGCLKPPSKVGSTNGSYLADRALRPLAPSQPVVVAQLTAGILFVLSISAARGAISFCAKSCTTCLNCKSVCATCRRSSFLERGTPRRSTSSSYHRAQYSRMLCHMQGVLDNFDLPPLVPASARPPRSCTTAAGRLYRASQGPTVSPHD